MHLILSVKLQFSSLIQSASSQYVSYWRHKGRYWFLWWKIWIFYCWIFMCYLPPFQNRIALGSTSVDGGELEGVVLPAKLLLQGDQQVPGVQLNEGNDHDTRPAGISCFWNGKGWEEHKYRAMTKTLNWGWRTSASFSFFSSFHSFFLIDYSELD